MLKQVEVASLKQDDVFLQGRSAAHLGATILAASEQHGQAGGAAIPHMAKSMLEPMQGICTSCHPSAVQLQSRKMPHGTSYPREDTL